MRPFFSVVVPTFRRPELLRRCIDSVRAQTFDDFELIVSDDERDAGRSWELCEAVRGADPRIRPIRNEGERGQVANTNWGVRHARGTWIKLLHDDDELYPECLRRFHDVLTSDRSRTEVSLACCRADRMAVDGRTIPWKPPSRRPRVEVMDRLHTPLAMYLQQDVGSSAPSCICINRAIVEEQDAYMPSHHELVSAVDTLWALNLARLGDRIIINESLVLKRDEPVSVTGGMTDEAMDREFEVMRRLQLESVSPELQPPPYEVAIGALKIRRALHRLVRRRSPGQAIQLMRECADPRAWLLATRMALGTAMPKAYLRALEP